MRKTTNTQTNKMTKIAARPMKQSRAARIAELERKMWYLFNIPIELMSSDIVSQYNRLEAEWKDLTNYKFL